MEPEAFRKQHFRKLLVTFFFALSNQQISHKIDPQNFSELIDQMTWQIPYKQVTLIDYICGRGNRLKPGIQDFPDVGRQLLGWAKKLLFGKIFAETCMKMKDIERGGGVPSAPLDPPM